MRSASSGTSLQVSIVYPDIEGAKPDTVEFRTYVPPSSSGLQSSGFHEDPSRGRADATLKA